MKVFLLHPDDDFQGSWTHQSWDSVVDLGRAPRSFYQEQGARLNCPVFSVFELAIEVKDLQAWRALLAPGLGSVVDRFGIDWWDVISLLLHPDLLEVRLALRLADKLRGCRSLVASRSLLTAEVLRIELGAAVQVLPHPWPKRFARSMRRRNAAAMNLTSQQLLQVVYDKYDPQYRWRSKLSSPPTASSEPVVLLPSAYINVTKTALSYARILPQQKFFLVLARESGAFSPVPENVEIAYLSSFATKSDDHVELSSLERSWNQMEKKLQENPFMRVARQLGIFRKGPGWLRWGLGVRNAWLRAFEARTVIGCLSADDSNPYTRIPLLLAEKRGIPAVACHHGALDCRMAFKNLRFSTYLAKGEMERDYLERSCGVDAGRIQIGSSSKGQGQEPASLWSEQSPKITFFSEPYETDSWRVEAIYREVLPCLCAAARRAGKTVLLKLHPFESARQRRRLVEEILSETDRELVTITDAPLSSEILRKTWCAVTVESTVAFESAAVGIPVFLCGWLRHAYAGYAPQYVAFGVGRMLESPDDLLRIPDLIGEARPGPETARRLVQQTSPQSLAELLCHPNAAEAS
jgi:hypothetical protein